MFRFRIGQAYLWRDGDELTLIDAGGAHDSPAIIAAVRDLGLRPEQVRRIVLTHGHPDHTGSAANWPPAAGPRSPRTGWTRPSSGARPRPRRPSCSTGSARCSSTR